MFCSFQNVSFACLLLYLFLGIYFFDSIVNEFFLISFLECIFQVYINTFDFCMLVLYSAFLMSFLALIFLCGFFRIVYIQHNAVCK